MGKHSIEKLQWDSLALMIVEAWDSQSIADSLNLEVSDVRRYADGRGPEGFTTILEGYRTKLVSAAVARRSRLIDLAEDAYLAIQTALTSQNEKVASDNAWRLLDDIAPRPQQPGIGIDVKLTQNNQTNTVILEAVGGISDALTALKGAEVPNFEKHLRSGRQAIPAALDESTDDAPDLPAEFRVEEPAPEEGLPADEPRDS